jgi:hypothetical protein
VPPVLLAGWVPLSPPGSPGLRRRRLRAGRVFPDGSAELVYAPAPPDEPAGPAR